MRTFLLAALSTLIVAPGCVVVGTTNDEERLSSAAVPPSGLVAPAASAAFIAAAEGAFNGIRSNAGLSPLRFDPRLHAAAQRHATDMALAGFRSHRGSDGSRFPDRARAAGSSCAVAENITWGRATVEGAFDWWQNSPDHNRALLRRDARTFGLAEANRIWVLVIGRC